MGNTGLEVEEVKVMAGRGLEESHPHDPHSHHPEGCYAHPAGLQEADPQVCIPVNAYLDTFGTMFRQKVLG